MRHSLFSALMSSALVLSVACADEIDDSSYESLFKAAFQSEVSISGTSGDYLKTPSQEALIKFNGFDLLPLVIEPYQEPEKKELDKRRSAVLSKQIAERLFREGRIDEGITFLKKMLPPPDPTYGMLSTGYVSDALLEQKRFEEAWQIAGSGTLFERGGYTREYGNISRYIQQSLAKNHYEKVPSQNYDGATRMSLIPNLPPYFPNKDDAEIYRAEANRALEYLLQLPNQLTDNVDARDSVRLENECSNHLKRYVIPCTLAMMGRNDEALAFVRSSPNNEGNERTVLAIIQKEKERHKNGTQEEVDQFDAFEKSNINAPAYVYHRYYNEILTRMIDTDFRYNSKELIDRLVKHHDTVVEYPTTFPVGGNLTQVNQELFVRFYQQIINAQLNLGLVDDAIVSLRKITGSPNTNTLLVASHDALTTSFGDIVYYARKSKTPQEAEQIEAAVVAMFKDKEWGDYYLVEYYANIAVRLMNGGEKEKGTLYLDKAVAQVDALQRQAEERTGHAVNLGVYLRKVCEILVAGGYVDEAEPLANQLKDDFPTKDDPFASPLYLLIAEKRAAAGETEKARAALQTTFDSSPVMLSPGQSRYPIYAKQATLAARIDDKELFYKILNACMENIEKENWGMRGNGPNEALKVFVRQLAAYGDKDHPLFGQTEKMADDYENMPNMRNYRAELYYSLGVSRAMLDDHASARRLLKKGLEAQREDVYGNTTLGFCAAILESRSYEK